MENIKNEDFVTGRITESGYYLFRAKGGKTVKVGEVDFPFETIEIVGEASINVTDVSFEGAMEYVCEKYEWFKIPYMFRND